MAKLKKGILKFALSFITGIISGILIGTAAFCTMISYKIDSFYERIATLENTINDKDAQLQNLEKAINSKTLILKSIEIVLITHQNGYDEIDEIDRIEIESTIKEKFLALIGDEVQSLDADIIMIVVDNRILKLNEKEYILRVDKLILTETLKLWVEVETID